MRWLRDRSLARLSSTIDYDVTTMTAIPAKLTAIDLQFYTKDDDKDEDDRVEAYALSEGQMVSPQVQLGEPHHIWRDQTQQPDPGKLGEFRLNLPKPVEIGLIQTGKVAVVVRKTGDKGWKFTAEAWGHFDDGTMRRVLRETEKIEFGGDTQSTEKLLSLG